VSEPTISITSLESLASEAFGQEFVRIGVRTFKHRAEKITVYTLTAKAKADPKFKKEWSHSLEYSHDRPGGDPDAVRKHVRDNLRGVIEKRGEERA
jgi:hypothetical protein